jgi:bifunctional oligoribonuclease and PAP phosphatase NrnA
VTATSVNTAYERELANWAVVVMDPTANELAALYPAELLKAAEVVRAAAEGGDSVALACHVSPDGDALGSMLGFAHLADAAGLKTVSAWPNPLAVAHHYRSIPGLDRGVASSEFPEKPPVMMTFDCGSLGRLVELKPAAQHAAEHGQLVVLDHHVSNSAYGSINAISPTAAATAVVVRELARELGWELNHKAAWCLYVGLVTDTGKFQYQSVTPAVFGLAEELSSFGLPLARISRELFDEHRFAYVRLAADALSRAHLDEERGFVSTSVLLADLARFGVGYEEAEGLIDWVRSTAEAEVACVLKEAPEGFRVSLRAVEHIDVGAIAAALGGGGHRLAAGFTMRASVAEVRGAVIRELDRQRFLDSAQKSSDPRNAPGASRKSVVDN